MINKAVRKTDNNITMNQSEMEANITQALTT